jgi:ribosomal protein uL23
LDSHEIILYPVTTEVTSRILETENKLVFVVNNRANKRDIKRAVEELYDVQVEKVNVTITPRGEKKAFVTLHPDHKAVDVAIKLGVI